MRATLSILVAASLTLVAACAPAKPAPAPAPTPVAENTDAACAARGGSLEPVGRLQRLVCVVPYADAGKICSDKADCQGACIAKGGKELQDATSGVCQKSNVQFGCYAKIVNGKATAALCVD